MIRRRDFPFKIGDKIIYKYSKDSRYNPNFIMEITAIGEGLFLAKELGRKTESAFILHNKYIHATPEQIKNYMKRYEIPTHKTKREELSSDFN